MIVVIYKAIPNKYFLISKSYSENDNLFQGLNCQMTMDQSRGRSVNGSNDGNTTESVGGSSSSSSSSRPEKNCGPYHMKGRTKPRDWLLNGLQNNRRHKYLPLFYDSVNMELIVVLNKEYEMFGENPSLIRDKANVFYKSIKYNDSAYGWSKKALPDHYVYTAFVKEGEKVYLIGEPFSDQKVSTRGPSKMYEFDLKTKSLGKKVRLKHSSFLVISLSFDFRRKILLSPLDAPLNRVM